jgi:PAS domain S-box-containing protein
MGAVRVEHGNDGRIERLQVEARRVRLLGAIAALHLLILLTTAGYRSFEVFGEHQAMAFSDWLGLAVLCTAGVMAGGLWHSVRVARGLGAEARSAQQREAQLLETTNEWFWSVDLDGTFLSSNAAVENLLGYQVDEIIGRVMPAFIPAEDRKAVLADRLAVASRGEPWSERVVRFRHRDGSDRWLESNGVPVVDDAGTVSGFRGATRDVTRRVLDAQADAAARDAFREKRARIAAAVSDPDGRLRMVFQPIIGMDGSMAGVEALARFTGPPNRAPDKWFAEASEVGLGVELELTAMRLAIAELANLPDGYLAVNLSPTSFLSNELLAIVNDPAFPAPRIVVELTEHVEITAYEDLRAAIAQLRGAGIRLAVDDAGSGFASLKHILELRPDVIKLDRAMVSGIDADPARRALAAAVADFAASIGARVVAEGVEEIAELQAIRVAGIGWAQGYLFGQPGPPPVIAATPAPSGVRAIVVDDDPVVRMLVSGMARQAGIQMVGQASDGREGLELAAAEQPDIVVLDLSMPVMRGEEALPELRRRLPDAFIIVLSAVTDVEVATHLVEGPANAFVAKSDVAARLGELFATVLADRDMRVQP